MPSAALVAVSVCVPAPVALSQKLAVVSIAGIVVEDVPMVQPMSEKKLTFAAGGAESVTSAAVPTGVGFMKASRDWTVKTPEQAPPATTDCGGLMNARRLAGAAVSIWVCCADARPFAEAVTCTSAGTVPLK